MARVLITGSTTGLGRAAALELVDEGHEVIVHARNRERAATLDDLAAQGARIVVGDKVIDATVRGRLDAMAAALAH